MLPSEYQRAGDSGMVDSSLFKEGVFILDGTFILKVVKNKMEAFVRAKDSGTHQSLETIGPDRLREELEKNGVIYGVLSAPESKGSNLYRVAVGTQPVHGEDSRFRLHVKPSVVRTPKRKNPDRDVVDYRELGSVVNVTKDKLLLEKIPATSGKAGMDVLGDSVSPKPGKDRNMKGGTGVYFSEDEMNVFAKFDGKFVMVDGRPSVFNEHVVKGDIDLSVGNIAFGGTNLIVTGEVLPGFVLKCRGNIKIGGGVNNAIVMAGGDLEVKGGIVGEDAQLRAKGNVTVDFVGNGPFLDAGRDLIVEDFIVQSQGSVGCKLTAINGKGAIIGGKFVVGGSMYVKELGSDAEIATEVSVGIIPSLQTKKQKVDEELDLWSVRLSEVLKNISSLEAMKKELGGKLQPQKEELRKKCQRVMPKAMDKVHELTEMQKAVAEQIDQMVSECVYVYGKVFPGVSIRIGTALRTLTAEEEQVVIHFDQATRQIFARKMSREETAIFEQ